MMLEARAFAIALALSVIPAGETMARPVAKAPASVDWTRAFAVTPEGGFRIGDPKAKIAIVEYGSLTCPHCRHFAETAVKPLVDQYVRTGKVSYEFRSFVLNGIDLAATLVARCSGPSRFFGVAQDLYATQPEWLGKMENLPKEEQDRLGALPNDQLLLAIAKRTGLLSIGAAHRIPAAKAENCLKDDAQAKGLMKMVKVGADLGVKGTPTFFLNGKQVPVYDWATLEPFLKEAGG
jgi:protein-disulfide isomerase